MDISSILNPAQDENEPTRETGSHETPGTTRLPYRNQRSQAPVSENTHSFVTSRHIAYVPSQLSSTSPPSQARRPSRPAYSLEEEDFIWYHRADLGLGWVAVEEAFADYFGSRSRAALQCRYYRSLKEHDVPQVRRQRQRNQQRHCRELSGAYGVIERSHRRYSWMLPQHHTARMSPRRNGG